MTGSSLRWFALPPWRRAPLRLWRAPALVLAVLGAAAVLGFAAGSRPLLVTSTSTSVLADDLHEGCAYSVGLTVDRRTFVTAPEGTPLRGGPVDPAEELDRSTAILRTRVAPIGGLQPLTTTLFTDRATAAAPGPDGRSGAVQLMARTGATDHIRALDDAGGTGVWITDATARQLSLGAGDRLAISLDTAQTTVRIRGVYADLRNGGRDEFWCSQQRAFIETFPVTPAPTVILDQGQLLRVLLAIRAPFVDTSWEVAPRPAGWTLARARPTLARLRALALESGNPSSPLARGLGASGARVDSIGSVDHARTAATDAAASVGPAALGTAVVALLVLVVAARTWLARRHEEIRVLVLRGAGPVLIGVKGVLELGPPSVLGGAIGLATGAYVVRTAGPASPVDHAALAQAAGLILAATSVALAAIGLIAALGTRQISVTADGAGVERPLWPWELVALTLAAASFWELRAGGNTPATGGRHVDSLVLLFPVLLLAGGAGLLARLALRVAARRRQGAPGAGATSVRGPLWAWLTVRRLTASPARVVPVVTAVALAVGMVVLASSLSTSLQATVEGKGLLGPGAEQVFGLVHPQEVPVSFPARDRATAVLRSTENSVIVAGHEPADVLGVDPTTFARAAFWDGSFAGRSLASLMRSLTTARGPELPVLAVGAGLPDRFSLSLDGEDGPLSVAVHVVGRARAFPGFHFNTVSPLVVASRQALLDRGFQRGAEIWVRGADPHLARDLVREHVDVISAVQAADRLTGTLRPQLAVFDYVRIVGAAASIVALCGLGLYVAAGADRRRLGRVLAVHMGLGPRDRLLATITEMGAMIGGGLIAGVALALVAFRLVVGELDPLPGAPPPMLVRVDRLSVVACAIGAIVTTLVAALLIEGRARRASLPDLLHRDG